MESTKTDPDVKFEPDDGPGGDITTVAKVRWHESFVVRTAALAALIIVGGYLASIALTINGIQSFSKLVYQKEINYALIDHLDALKKINDLHRSLAIARLKTVIAGKYFSETSPIVTSSMVEDWVKQAKFEAYFDLHQIKVRPLAKTETSSNTSNPNVPFMGWRSRSELEIFGFVVTLEQSLLRGQFSRTEQLNQRYQLIGDHWNNKIKPTFINANGIVILTTFLIFSTALFILARHLKKRIETFLSGFAIWSQQDQTYRFSDQWRGELKMISQQFNRMADIVETNRKRTLYLEKVSSWQIIARKLAHEIKNPLTPIQMMISQLVRRYKPSDDNTEFGQLLTKCHTIIIEEVNRLRWMVDNFSKFAQLPSPKFANEDLVVICQQALDMQRATYQQHQFFFSSSQDEAPAVVDKNLIKQTLLNLLKNASESCGDTPAKISISIQATPKNYRINVIDNGPGIPTELQNRIFEAYFTTKHTGPSPGMGLGLAVCQKIIIDHSGEMLVTSHPGKTCFTLTLPREQKGLLT